MLITFAILHGDRVTHHQFSELWKLLTFLQTIDKSGCVLRFEHGAFIIDFDSHFDALSVEQEEVIRRS